MITKMRVWKLIGLYIVTLGIYGFVWLARKRTELQKATKRTIPHWLWLLLPAVIAVFLTISAAILLAIVSLFEPLAIFLLVLIVALNFFICFGISIWWFWKFGKAVDAATHRKVPAEWTLAYWILLGPVTFFMNQYFLNRREQYTAHTKNKPTTKFVAWSLVAMVLVGAISYTTYIETPEFDFDPTYSEMQSAGESESDALSDRVDFLNDKYDACLDELDMMYPSEDMSDETYERYEYDFAYCESVYEQYEAAYDEYTRSPQAW